jgi:hypothetical protein
MTDPQTQREQTSLKQLGAVAQARQIRLQAERQVLAQRERDLALALESQSLDESLLEQQRVQWAGRWQDWVKVGGALRYSKSLRQDKDLLMEMAVLLAGRRAQLQTQVDALNIDLSNWNQKWLGAQAFEESLVVRGRALRVALERAAERQRDEESLMALAVPSGGSAVLALQGW